MIVGVRPMTEAEKLTLDSLNDAVTSAIAARREWLDHNMHERSPLQPGDDIYDVDSGRKLGVVSRLYRYWRDRDEGVRDTSSGPSFEYKTSSRGIDNTSRQCLVFGSLEEARKRAEQKLASLSGSQVAVPHE